MTQNRIFLSLGNFPCFHSPKKNRLSEFVDFYLSHKGRIGATEHTISGIRTALKCLLDYRGDVKMSGINGDYCEGFLQYLKIFRSSGGKILSPNTALAYFKSVNAAFNYAARRKIISSNPFCSIDKEARINPKRTEREFLTAQEIQAMIEAKCPNKEVKTAFLFSCFCGLRISDVRNLRWEDLRENGWGGHFANIIVCKTGQPLRVPLSSCAMHFLPPAGTGRIFSLPSSATISKAIAAWAIAAGVKKHITFHCARHSFATLMLSCGADIYTVSKLLGHSNVTVTQVYARVMDERKTEAVERASALFDHPQNFVQNLTL